MVRPSEIERVLAEVAARHGVDPEAVRGPRGRRTIYHARWEAWRELAQPGVSIASIARAWPCDHTSILYGLWRLAGGEAKARHSRSLAS